MKSSKALKTLVVGLLVLGMVGGVAADRSLAYDGFEDGDFSSSPSWSVYKDGGSAFVQSSTVWGGSNALKMENTGSDFQIVHDRGGDDEIEDGDSYVSYVKFSKEGIRSVYGLSNSQSRTGPDAVFIQDRDASDVSFNLCVYDSSGSYDVCKNIGDGSSSTAGYWLKYNLTFYPSSSQVEADVSFASGGYIGGATASYTGATDIRYVYMNQLGYKSGNTYFDSVTYSSNPPNSAPSIDSTGVSPDPPLIGENVSYSMSASDSDGTVSSGELTVFKDGQQVYQDSQSFSSSSIDYTWSDVYVAQSEGDLDARFTVTDDAGASTTEWLNRTLQDNAPEINISEPEGLYGTDSVPYSVYVSSDDSKPGESISVNVSVDNSVIESSSVTESGWLNGTTTSLSDGAQSLEVTAEEEDGDSSTKTSSFEVDTSPPQINITEPTGPTDTRTGLWLNYSVSDPNLDSSTCEYSKDGGGRISASNCENLKIDFGSVGNKTVTVYASDSVGNEGSSSKTVFVDDLNAVRLNESVSGDIIQNFSVTLSNGDNSIGGTTDSGVFTFYTSNTPEGLVDMILKSSGYQTRTVTLTDVDDSFRLNRTYSMDKAGFTLEAFDEASDSSLEFNFTASNSTTAFSRDNVNTFSRNFSELKNLGFPTGDVTVRGEKQGYKSRTYFVGVNDNTKVDLDGYLLPSNQGIFMTVQILSPQGDAVQGAGIDIQRLFGASYKTVAEGSTKSDGTAAFFLSPDSSYRIVASHPSYNTFTGTFSPVNYQYDPLKIRLSGSKTNFTDSTVWDEVSYKMEPMSEKLNSSDSYVFNWSVVDTSGELSYVELNLKDENRTVFYSTSVSGSPSGTKLSLPVNLSEINVSGDLVAEGIFVKDGKKFVYRKRYNIIPNVEAGSGSIKSLLQFAGKNLSSHVKGFLAAFIAAFAGISASRTDVLNKGAGALGLLVLGLFVSQGWFPGFPFYASVLAYLGVVMYR